MIDSHLDTVHSILYVRPTAAFTADDFFQLAKQVDPFIKANGTLAGLIIETPSFPGWDNLVGMVAHFRFVHDHHKYIKKNCPCYRFFHCGRCRAVCISLHSCRN